MADRPNSTKACLRDDIGPATPSVELSFTYSVELRISLNHQQLDTERITMASDEAHLNLLLWQTLSSTPNHLLVGYVWSLWEPINKRAS